MKPAVTTKDYDKLHSEALLPLKLYVANDLFLWVHNEYDVVIL